MHVAFAVQPAHGHVDPMRPPVPELPARGHRYQQLITESGSAKAGVGALEAYGS